MHKCNDISIDSKGLSLFFLLYLEIINTICKSLLMKYEGYTSQLTIAPSLVSTF
jgi:hypothetical protein